MKNVIVFFALFFAFYTYAETISSFKVSSDHPKMQEIADTFEVVDKQNDQFLVYVLHERLKQFRKLAPEAQQVSQDVNGHLKVKGKLKGYHSFQEVQQLAKKFQDDYPNLVKLIPYGKSKKGLPLFALKVSDNVKENEHEKKIMLTSATHGDELITVEVLLRLTKQLLEGYSSNQRFKNIIDNTEIYFIFVVNPEGFTRRSRYADGIDPNRQYPWPGHPNRETPVPAIDALIEFYKKHNFDGSMDFHAFGKMVMFPWGYTREPILQSDHQIFSKLTKSMAQKNRYRHGPIAKVIYIAKGSSADFYYAHNKGLALAIELTTRKAPWASRIPRITKEASEMTWLFLEHFI
jgi:hypothetical protein